MSMLAGFATLSFVVVAGITGTRLLLLARHTRQLPELSIGLALILVVFLGYPLSLGATLPGVDPAVAKWLFVVSTLVSAAGSCFIFVFTRSVFRPEEAWALLCVRIAIAAIVAVAVVNTVSMGDRPVPIAPYADPGGLLALGIYTLGYLWTAVEAFRYHALMRRRQALGLADPVVTNRFLLWAISGTSATIGIVVPIVAVLLGGSSLVHTALPMLTLGLAGVTSSSSTYLAFMPPTAWIRWIEGGHAATA